MGFIGFATIPLELNISLTMLIVIFTVDFEKTSFGFLQFLLSGQAQV